MNEFLLKDREALLFLNGLGSPMFDNFWMLMSGKWLWIPLYVIFFHLLYRSFGLKKTLYILLFISIGITVSDQLAGIFKNGVMRLRPCHDTLLIPKMRMVTCGGEYGFYSSHASNSFFLVTFLSIMLGKKLRWLPYLLVFWASLVSYSRIYLGVHFPLDVLFGVLVGFLLGGLFANLAKRVVRKEVVDASLRSA